MRRVALAALLAALVALAAGCGGGGTAKSTNWIAQADTVCSWYAGRLAKLKPQHTLKQIVVHSQQVLPLQQEALRRLRKVQPPKAQRALYRMWLRLAVSDQIRMTRVILRAAKTKDRQYTEFQIERAQNLQLQSNGYGIQIGFKVCAGPPQ